MRYSGSNLLIRPLSVVCCWRDRSPPEKCSRERSHGKHLSSKPRSAKPCSPRQCSYAQQQCARALKTLASVELPVLSCQAYALKGQIQAAAGHDRRAYEAYQSARTHLDSLRNRIHGEELKISFMKDRVLIYEGLVALCMKGAGRSDASREIFHYIEQAKSRTLLDFLSASQSPSWLAPQDQTPACQENPRDSRGAELVFSHDRSGAT